MSKREIIRVKNLLDYYITDMEHTIQINQNRLTHFSNNPFQNDSHHQMAGTQRLNEDISQKKETLKEIRGQVKKIDEKYRNFYRRQAEQRKELYGELSPLLEGYAEYTDNILESILTPQALVQKHKHHHTRIFTGDRESLKKKRAVRRQNQVPYFRNSVTQTNSNSSTEV